MTGDDEDLIRHLCARAAVLMGSAACFVRSPPEEMGDLIDVLERLACRSEAASKLIAATLALIEY